MVYDIKLKSCHFDQEQCTVHWYATYNIVQPVLITFRDEDYVSDCNNMYLDS